MSKQTAQKDNGLDELALLGLTAGNSGGGSAAQEALTALLYRRFAKEEQAETDAEAQKAAFREATIAGVNKAREDRERAQAICPHMKPNFRPATGGQKDHNGNFHFICQYCAKEFGNDLPGHLRISADMIGGPQ